MKDYELKEKKIIQDLIKDKENRINKNISEIRNEINFYQHAITLRLLDKLEESIRNDDIRCTEEWTTRYHHFMAIHNLLK